MQPTQATTAKWNETYKGKTWQDMPGDETDTQKLNFALFRRDKLSAAEIRGQAFGQRIVRKENEPEDFNIEASESEAYGGERAARKAKVSAHRQQAASEAETKQAALSKLREVASRRGLMLIKIAQKNQICQSAMYGDRFSMEIAGKMLSLAAQYDAMTDEELIALEIRRHGQCRRAIGKATLVTKSVRAANAYVYRTANATAPPALAA